MSVIDVNGPFHPDDWRREKIATIIVDDVFIGKVSQWFTENNQSLQVGLSCYKSGHECKRHYHPCKELLAFRAEAMEVLILRKGKMLARFWDSKGEFAGEWTMNGGDIVIIFGGQHSFTMLDEVELLEVKLGPFDPKTDKVYIGGDQK